MNYIIKPIVCDYAVISVNTSKIMCICNIRSNADLITDILNADCDREMACYYGRWPYAPCWRFYSLAYPGRKGA